MSLESVKAWLARHAPDLRLIEAEDTTATVETAAKALGVEPGRIAKTLTVRAGEHLFLLCTRGDARLDNRKCKDEFAARPRMLGAEETFEVTGHPVGGVCPFGLKQPLPRKRFPQRVLGAKSLGQQEKVQRSLPTSPGDGDDLSLRVFLPQPPNGLETFLLRHQNVRDDEVRRCGAIMLQPF